MTKGIVPRVGDEPAGTFNPVLFARSRRNAFKGVAGNPDADLEERAMRALNRLSHIEVRDKNLAEQAELRRAAIRRRKTHQMRAADYARDRRSRT